MVARRRLLLVAIDRGDDEECDSGDNRQNSAIGRPKNGL